MNATASETPFMSGFSPLGRTGCVGCPAANPGRPGTD